MPAAACSNPIRLRVESQWHSANGSVVESERITDGMPDGVLYVACKNRRASVCPACSQTYRADMYHLIKAGLVGGKGVPASVANHPTLFATFSAPSFGPVHSASKPGKPRVCHPRRIAKTCPHGVRLACWSIHGLDDTRVGEPLCRDCYDYDHQAVWNLHAGELWRRTTIAINRALTTVAKTYGVKVRLSYAKVAEYQCRGVIHFHALIRLDGYDPDDPTTILPPPAVISLERVRQCIADAVAGTTFHTAPHPRNRAGWQIGWGEQLDLRAVRLTGTDLDDSGQITTTAVAGYLAKYATKATEDTGHSSRRLTDLAVQVLADRGDSHQIRQLLACWYLGKPPLSCTTPKERQEWTEGWGRLQRWAHMLGFGGHFSTKSRRYSTTLTALRAVRKAFQRGEQPQPPEPQPAHDADQVGEQAEVTVTYLFDGVGWLTTADAQLANTAAAKAREHRRIAREELDQLYATN
jgi:hypothetical protein